jgi:hypothetical protein
MHLGSEKNELINYKVNIIHDVTGISYTYDDVNGGNVLPDRNIKMLSCVATTKFSHAEVGGPVPAEDLHAVLVARLINGAATVQLKFEKVQSEIRDRSFGCEVVVTLKPSHFICEYFGHCSPPHPKK